MLTRIEECLYSVPGEFDVGLVRGGALAILSSVADDRVCVQLPAVVDPWDDRDGWVRFTSAGVVLFGPRGETVLTATDAVLERVWDGPPPKTTLSLWPTEFPLDPPWEPGVLVVPATGQVRRVVSASEVHAETITRLGAIRDHPGVRMVVRMNPQAAVLTKKQVRLWIQRDPELVGPRLERWIGVAALSAIWERVEQPVISADMLVMAEQIVADHELACSVMCEELIGRPPHLVH